MPILSCPQIRIMSDEVSKGSEAQDTYDDTFLKKIETGMLSQISLQVCVIIARSTGHILL